MTLNVVFENYQISVHVGIGSIMVLFHVYLRFFSRHCDASGVHGQGHLPRQAVHLLLLRRRRQRLRKGREGERGRKHQGDQGGEEAEEIQISLSGELPTFSAGLLFVGRIILQYCNIFEAFIFFPTIKYGKLESQSHFPGSYLSRRRHLPADPAEVRPASQRDVLRMNQEVELKPLLRFRHEYFL